MSFKYKVTKLSTIKHNSGITISPGIYDEDSFPKDVWEYLLKIKSAVKVDDDKPTTQSKPGSFSLTIKMEDDSANKSTKPRRKTKRTRRISK